MNVKREAMQATLWSFLDLWGNKVGNTLIFFVLIRLLTPEAFGLLTLGWMFIVLVQTFADLGLGKALIQREELKERHLDTAFWTILGVSLLLTALVLLGVSLGARLGGDQVLLGVVAWLSACVPLRALSSVQMAILTRSMSFKTLTLRSVLASIAGGVVGITMAVLGYGVWSLVGQQITYHATAAAVLWGAVPWRPALRFSRQRLGELSSFGLAVMAARAVDYANRRADNVLVGLLLGPVALGYYATAYKIVLVLTEGLTQVISSVTLPVFSRLQRDPDELRRLYYGATRLMGVFVVPAFAGLIVTAPLVVPVVFGPQWTESIPLLQILALLGVAQCVFFLEDSLMLALGKASWRLRINLVSALGMVAAFVIAYRWGVEAVAVAMVLRSFLLVPLGLALMKRLLALKVRRYARQFVTPFAGALGMLVLCLLAAQVAGESLSAPALLALQVLVGMAGYGAIVFALDRPFLAMLARHAQRALLSRREPAGEPI